MKIPVNLFRLGTTGIIMAFIMMIPMDLSATTKYYVDINRPDDSGNGTSWATAKKHLQSALHLVSGYGGADEIEIWVAAGTYNPSYEIDGGYGDYSPDRHATFDIPSGVAVYGGFTGSEDEVDLSQRDWANNVTILSGDIDGNDAEGDRSGNSYHVVSFYSVNQNTVLDGFTITGGNADGDDEASNGGGIFNDFSYANDEIPDGGVNIRNCIISGNSAANNGGGMYNHTFVDYDDNSEITGHAKLTNCVISGNRAGVYGGGIYGYSFMSIGKHYINHSLHLRLINCTITGNSAVQGGGVYHVWDSDYPSVGGATSTVINCIFWNNHGGDSFVDSDLALNTIRGHEEDFDPNFLEPIGPENAPTKGGDFHLIEGSPAIDSGTSDGVDLPDLDLDGNPRIQNDIIDMGAFEGGVPPPLYMVDADSPDGGNGEDWDHAFNKLQDALMVSAKNAVIWVAAGTYYPDEGAHQSDNERLSTFNIPNGVKVYGGFDGTDGFEGGRQETELSDRDPEIYEVILSGDIDGNDAEGDRSGNSYHVVSFGGDAQEGTIFDGFTITGGNADGDSELAEGGGIRSDGSPELSNLIITGNSASSKGGGIYCSGGYLTNCTISNNSSGGNGGGIYIRLPTDITDCEVINNSIDPEIYSGHGGGIYNGEGGTFTRCIISGNSISGEYSKGGGIYNRKVYSSFKYCIISGNVLTGAYGVGGGIYNLGSKISIINVTLTGNRAEYGGGMAGSNHDKGKMKANRAKVINSIFWNNGPSDQAYIGANAIVYNKKGVPEYWEDEYMYSNVEGSGGSGDSWNGDTGIGVDNGSNIDSDPFFVEAVNILTVPTSSGDFNLTQNSEESIDTGTLDTNNDGEDDIFEYLGSGPDMGAYEYTGMVLAADDEPPIVESLCPNSEGKCPDREADDFDVDTDLIITFQEPVEEGVGSITINTEGRDPVTIAVPSEEDAFNHATVTDRIVRIVLGDDLEQEVEYSVTVEENTFQDLNENSFAGIGDSEDDRWRFFIDNEPPQVSFNPAGGSTNNAQETNITLSFGEVVFMVDGGAELTDENVDALIVLEDASSDADIEFEATVANGDETVITVDPTSSFTSEQRVYVVIGSTVKDAAGNQIEGSDATFSIADVEDPTAVFDPANSATGVAPNADVTVTLSEAVTNGDGSEITDDNVATLITLKSDNDSGSDIPFSAEINDAKNVISIDPLTNYQSQQVVYVSLDAGVQDAAENEVSGTLNSTFTTANVEAPTVTVELSDDDIVFPTSLSTIGITVRFNEEVSGFELSDISFDPSENGSASDFSEILSGREYSANITLLGGTVSVSIPEGVATTADGLNISNSTSNMLALIYDATAPTIDYLPANGDVDVALDLDNITLTFSKRVKKLIEGSAEEITADNLWDVITLKKAARSEDTDFDNDGGTDVDYTATVEIAELETGGFGHKITLDPDSDFLDDKSEYYVSVNSDKIVDYSSVELLHAVSSATFSTANNLPPEITSFRYVVDEEQPISHRPGEFLTDVPNASDLIIVFDEDVRNNQDEAGFITLYKILGEELNQQVAIIYVSDSEIVTGNNSPEIRINLPDDLDSFADYFLTISPNSFKDMSDDMFGGINDPNAWTFRTLDETPPALVDHSPNPDDHEIFETEGDSPIELIFDEPVVVKHGNIEIYDSEYTLVETIDITDAEKIEILDVAPDVVRISPENLVSDSEYHILIVKAEEAVGALVDIAFPPNPLADIEDRSRIFIQTSDMRPPNILNYSLTENNALEPSIFNADWEMEVFGINDNVDINSHIVIRFDEDLFKNGGVLATNENIDEVIALKINEKTGSDIQFGASISDDSRMITLQPDELLVGGTTYYLQVKADYLEDAYGNDLHEDRWASFTTADTDPPLLVSTDPMNGDENVDIKSNIILQFDKNVTVEGRLIIVNTATNKTHTTILLTNEYKVLVEENVITIDKKTSLESNTSYHILIDTEAIIDPAGNAFAGIDDPEVFAFTTGDFESPEVTFTPEHLSEDIAVDADLVIGFSEPITIEADGGITDENVVSLIDFKSSPPYDQEQEEGDWEDVAFDAVINASADTITLTLPDDGDGNPTLLLGNRFYNMEIDEAIMDEVGNSIDPSPQFSRFLTAATDAPTVEVSTEVESPTNTSPIAVAIEFSEAVTEFNSDSLSLSGGDIESFSGEEASYSVSITPSEGEVSVQVEGDKGFNEFDTGNAASNKLVLIYDITSPIVTFAPADSTLDASLASKVYITFSEPVFTDNGAPVVLSDLTGSVSVRKDSIDGEVQSFGMAYNDTTGVIKLTPPDSLISAVDYYVAITAEVYDEAGNPFAGDSSYFKAEDIDPPTITLVPADGATDVAVDTYMRVIFSERVYSETGEKFEDFDVSEGMVVVRVDNASGSILNIGVQISPDTSALTIQTDELLKGEQTYHVQVNPRFADLNGTVVEKTTATFTTVDVIPPEIALTPDLGEQDVSPETELSISFSESVRLIDNSIMTAENVKDLLYVNLWNPEGEAIDFTVSVNAARDEISIVPSAILPPFEKIVFGLTDGLEDYSENLAGSAAGYFFTAGIPGFDISPRSGITTTETGLSDTFEVVLTSEPEYPVSFNIMSTDVTEGMSYPTQLTFTRDNWDQKQWVKVTGVDDPDADDDMTYHIKLFNITSDDPEYNGMEADSATCVNINDDPPGIKVYPISRLITTEEGKQAQFGIVLLSRPTATVTIPVSTSDVTEASVDVTQLVFDAEEWDQKQLVTLTGLDDDEDDDDIEYKIVLGESVSEDADYSAVDPTDILAINIDDDVAGFALGYDRIVRTNEMGTDTVFTVKLNTEPAGTVALSVSSDDATEGTVSHDYLTFTPADWNVVQEVTVTGLNDNLGDGDLYYNIMVGEAIVTASPAYGRLDAKEVKAVNLDREPQITTGSEFMSFDSSGIGIPDSASVYVLNVGPDTLVIAGVSVNDSAFSAMIAPSPIKSGDSSLVRVFFNPEQAGKKQSVLYVEHNDPYQFPKELLISASVRDKSGPAIIELESMPTTAAVGEGVEVTVHVLDVTGVFDIGLYYGNGIGNFDFTKMTEDSSGIYSGNIPTGIANLTGLVYFIVATDTKGNITYSDTVSVPVQFGDKQLSTDVSGSAYPSGISKDAWRLISVPNLIDENKATQIFGNELKDRNKRSWRLVSDFVSKETWQDVKEITPGMGMWLYQQVKDNVSISTGTGTTSDLSRHELTVRSGWSIIGSPYAFTFAADIDGEIFSGPFAYALDGVEGWSDVVTQFQPWAGYIIKNLTLEEQTLVLRPLASAGTDSTLKREIARKQIGWTVNLAALSGRVGDLYNKMGRQPGASESIGPFDHAEPPIMPGGISLAFRQGNGRSKKLMYARDMRSMAEHNGAWPMDLMVKDIKEPISFTVELDEHYPLDLGLVILDHQTREVTDLREDPDLKIHHSNEDIPYRFTVVSGDGDYIIRKVEEILAGIPERFSLGQNYPNPFNSTTTIRYALPLPEFVNITIYNILGQEVHKMVGSWQEAGFHTARWDGRDLHGIPVSSGVYIYHIQAGKFMSARKMAIIK